MWKEHPSFKLKSSFYLPHMEYERSVGFVSRKITFLIAYFHVLGLFIAKKYNLSEKKFSVCHAPLPLEKFVSTLAQSIWKLESWNFSPIVFWANLMYLILRILKFWILRVPSIQISIMRSTHSSKICLCIAKKQKNCECQSICSMWQVYKRPTSASDFFKRKCTKAFWDMHCLFEKWLLRAQAARSLKTFILP
jgi:hypothetical protein